MISADVRANARSPSGDGWNIPGTCEYPLKRRWIGGISIWGVASIRVRSISGPHRTVNWFVARSVRPSVPYLLRTVEIRDQL